MSVHEAMRELEAQLKDEGTRIVLKTGWFWNLLHWLVCIVTFGANRTFRDEYVTTIGPWIGVPKDWDSRSAYEG